MTDNKKISFDSLEELVFGLTLKTKSGVFNLPTMFEKQTKTGFLFSIPLYEENGDLFYPSSKDADEDSEYAEFGFLVIDNPVTLLELLKGNEVKIDNFVGRLNCKNELLEVINNGRLKLVVESI